MSDAWATGMGLDSANELKRRDAPHIPQLDRFGAIEVAIIVLLVVLVSLIF